MNIGAYTNHLLDSEPNLSEKELQERVNGYVALCWRRETPEGREFEKHFASPENINKLAEVFSLLDEEVSFETLSGALRKLVASGAIQTDAEREAARLETERQWDEANRIRWEQSCSEWLAAHNTNQIKSRVESDPAFRSWLKAANVPPIVDTEYDPVQLARQRKEIAAANAKNQPDYSDAELVEFATRYKEMSFAELKTQMNNPIFREQVQRASAAQLI